VTAQKPKAVFMAARWRYYTTGSAFLINASDENYHKNTKQRQEFIKENLSKTLREYEALGIKVYVLGQVPEQPFTPRRTYAGLHLPLAQKRGADQLEKYLQSMSADRAAHEEMLSYFEGLFKQWAAEGRITYLDPAPYFCGATKCPVGTATQSFYFDGDHLSKVGAEKLHLLLEKAMTTLSK